MPCPQVIFEEKLAAGKNDVFVKGTAGLKYTVATMAVLFRDVGPGFSIAPVEPPPREEEMDL